MTFFIKIDCFVATAILLTSIKYIILFWWNCSIAAILSISTWSLTSKQIAPAALFYFLLRIQNKNYHGTFFLVHPLHLLSWNSSIREMNETVLTIKLTSYGQKGDEQV